MNFIGLVKRVALKVFPPVIAMMVCAVAVLLLVATIACNDAEYHKLADANAKISSALGAITQETIDLTNAQQLDVTTAAKILQEVDHAVIVNGQFRDRLRQSKTVSPSDRQAFGAWISDIAGSLDRLNTQGVLHIKNPDTQAKFSSAVAAAQLAVGVVSAIVTTSEVERGSSNSFSAASARRGERYRDREVDRRNEITARYDRRAASRLVGEQGRRYALGHQEVLGAEFDVWGLRRAVVADGCDRATSIERDWRTGRCRVRA